MLRRFGMSGGLKEYVLTKAWTPWHLRRLGIASRLLLLTCEDADRQNAKLSALPWVTDDGFPTDVVLRQWLAKFGFEIANLERDDHPPLWMVRFPRKGEHETLPQSSEGGS